MNEPGNKQQFQAVILPHLDAAYSLARWLTRRPHDAEDIVQEALIRAMKYFSGFRGENARAWFLVIVRNSCYSWFQKNQQRDSTQLSDDEQLESIDVTSDPAFSAQSEANRRAVRKALNELPTEFREVVVLRDIEGLSYRDISEVVGLPMGTVMSRLSRARARLQELLKELRSPS